MNETGGQGADWTLNLSSEQAADLLSSLVEDDDFRRRLEQRPEEALAAKGVAAPRGAFGDRVTLPSKEDVIWAFGKAFPDWPRLPFISRVIRWIKPGPTPPVPFADRCKGWALLYTAASQVEPRPRP
jgi:hypothetical protein